MPKFRPKEFYRKLNYSNLYSRNQTLLSGGELIQMPYEEIGSGAVWGGRDLKKGDKIEGKLVEVAANSNNEDLRDYILEVNGDRVRVWGSTILCGKIGTADETNKFMGKNLRITFQGKVKAKRGMAKDFKVELKK